MKKILARLPKILMYIGIGTVVMMNLVMAFVLLAPPQLYDPIYNKLWGQPAAPTEQTGTENGGEEVPTAVKTKPTAAGDHTTPIPASRLEIKPGEGVRVDTGTKIVNLVDPTGRKYLRAGIVLEFSPDVSYFNLTGEERTLYETTFNEEIKPYLPIINDKIISLLSSKTFEDVYTAEGKEKLRKEIMDSINAQLPEFDVIFVYYTEFVVQ